MIAEQSKVPDYEQPKLLTTDIADKIESLKREINYLITKAKYFKPKPKKTVNENDKTNKNKTAKEESDKDSSKKPVDEDNDNYNEDFENMFGDKSETTTKAPKRQPKTEEPTENEEKLELGDGTGKRAFSYKILILI